MKKSIIEKFNSLDLSEQEEIENKIITSAFKKEMDIKVKGLESAIFMSRGNLNMFVRNCNHKDAIKIKNLYPPIEKEHQINHPKCKTIESPYRVSIENDYKPEKTYLRVAWISNGVTIQLKNRLEDWMKYFVNDNVIIDKVRRPSYSEIEIKFSGLTNEQKKTLKLTDKIFSCEKVAWFGGHYDLVDPKIISEFTKNLFDEK